MAPDNTTRLDIVFDQSGTLERDGIFRNFLNQNVITVGDNANNVAVSGFISINLNSLPATANVTSAMLQLKANAPFGNPFGDFVTLRVDHVNVINGIDATDYFGSSIKGVIATVPPLPTTTRQDVSIDVTSELNADRAAGRPISSFRFQFDQAPTADAQGDLVFIEASPDDPAGRPSALVTISP